MKTYLISDNVDTFVGLKISGIIGQVAHTREEVLSILKRLMKEKETGIIIITEKIGDLIPEEVTKIKLAKTFPLLVEIPDRHGSTRGEDHIMKLVKESIGLKI